MHQILCRFVLDLHHQVHYITLKLSAKEVIIDFNDPANFYEGYLFSNGIEGKALDISTAAYYRAPLPI